MKLMSGSTGPQATRTRLAGTLVLAVGIVSLMGAGAAADPHVGQSVNVAVVDSTGVTNGGYFPTTGGYLDDFTFTDVAVGSVNATTLMSYDTVLLNVASSGMGCDTASLTADQKNDLVDFVYNGGKLIIYDSECPAVDYSWLPYPFTTNNPGPQGEQGTLTIAEQNVLSSTDPGDPHYIDAAAVASQTDAVGDMNVMTTLDPAWCLDMTGTNATPATGPVHTYARYGNGLFIYNGFDVDDMPSGDVPNGLQKTWIQELQAPFNPSPEADLPCGIPVVGPPARVDSTQKGSLLVYPKVELRWDAAGNMIQDTFVDITNDYPGSVEVQMYFVNGDPALDAVYDDINGDPGRACPHRLQLGGQLDHADRQRAGLLVGAHRAGEGRQPVYRARSDHRRFQPRRSADLAGPTGAGRDGRARPPRLRRGVGGRHQQRGDSLEPPQG